MMLTHFVLIRFIFNLSKYLAVCEMNKIVSFIRSVSYTLIDNYMYKNIRDRSRYGIWRTVYLGELVVDSQINQRLDMSVMYAMGGVKNHVLFEDAPT